MTTDGIPEPPHSCSAFNSSLGRYQLHAFEIDGREHAALVVGTPEVDPTPLARVQSACLTGTAFGALLCDCRSQLHLAMELVGQAGSGVVLYLAQEGRGHGFVNKVTELSRLQEGMDTVDAAASIGLSPDTRDYACVRVILDELGVRQPLRLLTNNPEKIRRLESAGVPIVSREPIETEPTQENTNYLLVKKQRMGHLLTRV